MQEKEQEAQEGQTLQGSPISSMLNEKKPETDELEPNLGTDTSEFAPIRSRGQPISRPASRTGSLSRQRFNNGYGVDWDEEQQASPAEPVNDGPPEKDPFEVGWENGDADPLCPRSFPAWKKWTIVFITSFGSFCVTNASAIYTSTYTQMDAEFGNSRIVATLGLSTFVLGIAWGFAWSPLAEFYGRRPIYLSAFAVYMLFIIPSAVAQNIQTMIIARFFQGLAGSAFLSVSGGTVGDMFVRQEMQAPMAVFTLAPFIGPSMGPLFGGLINSYTNWRWTHYMLIIWSFCLLVLLTLFVPETYHPVLLKRKARKLRKESGDERYKAPLETSEKSFLMTLKLACIRPFQILFFEPMALILDLYSALLLGILYLFFGAFPLVFMNNHGFNLWQVGLSFLGLLVAMIFAVCCTPFFHRQRDRLAEKRGREVGGEPQGEPEDQLPSVIVGAPLISIGLFVFGFSTYPWVHWIVPIIGSGIFALGTLFAFVGIFTFLVDAYPLYAASALAGNAFVRCTFAAAFPLFGVQMYEKLGYQWATALLAFLTVAMLPFPYLFFRFGKKLRARSRFAKG